jgi:uncharacterized membrane protein YdjX (TVP38/TMEM64 family)
MPTSLFATVGCFFFGWDVGFPVAVCANWTGALFAFWLGRFFMLERVREAFNEIGPSAQTFSMMITRFVKFVLYQYFKVFFIYFAFASLLLLV